MQKIIIKIFLKLLYIKTKIHQKIYQDGAFPYDDYARLSFFVYKYNLKTGLEVGTGIGLSAISACLDNKDFNLDTIEKQERNVKIAKKNILFFDKIFKNLKLKNRINILEGRMFDVLEFEECKNKKYDYIFLDAYISRYNEVIFLENFLKRGGVFAVSNIREDFQKSIHARDFLLDTDRFVFLEMLGDTIFVKKK